MTELDRRGFLLLAVAGALSGCDRGPTRPVTSPSLTPAGEPSTAAISPSAAPPAAPASRATLPATQPWQPDPRDLEPAAKLAAVRFVEHRDSGAHSAVTIIDAQYGGLLTASASVLVVTQTWTLDGHGRLHAGGATYDVRVIRAGRAWRVTAVHPSRPGGPAPTLSTAAREVLASPRVELPPAARADVRSGQVHDSVLTAMLRLARSYRIGVSVVRSGHPLLVFGTSRSSDHPRGRAFDTWRIDGHPVVDAATPRRLVAGFMEAAATAGAYNVGGPYRLGAAPQFFSDRTHHDHVHAGFTS